MSPHPVRVLVVDDEPQIRRLLRTSLTGHGYEVLEAASAEDAVAKAADGLCEVILLDLGLPDRDGLHVISQVREWSRIPIIVLSIRSDERDKIKALDLGADDYVTKPFAMGELLARIRTALRHRIQAEVSEPVFRCGDLTVDLAARIVSVDGQEVKLSLKEYELLRVLVSHAGKVLTHQQLLREVWGPGYALETHYLRVYIRQ
ncbi:MAG: response regulator, partial [Armatimonadetes bacterium]|nr:response regulator [Armatimonadota bacterium]